MPITSPADTLSRLKAKPGAKVELDDAQYVAMLLPRPDGAMFTFTKPGHPAHPAIVCRKPIPAEGGGFRIGMQATCGGPKPGCEGLVAAFQRHIDRK